MLLTYRDLVESGKDADDDDARPGRVGTVLEPLLSLLRERRRQPAQDRK
jgi:hypothetical protein